MRRILAITAALAGCVTVPPEQGDIPRVASFADERAYQEALERYSVHQELYAVLDTHAFLATTLESWPFRQARVRREAEFQQEPPPVVEAHLAQEQAEFSQEIVFTLGLYVTDYHFDDVGRPGSPWRIALVTGSGEVTPSSVERVGRATFNLRGYYPYLGDFWTAYRIHFPRVLASGTPTVPPEASSVTLRVASTLGQANLTVPAQ